MLAVVLTTAQAAPPRAQQQQQQQQQQADGGRTEPLFFATQHKAELLTRLPVEPGVLPAVSPAWRHYAALA
eukprot:15095003-Alexandrium_andersonii.AAC.1